MIKMSGFYCIPLIAGLCFSFVEILKRTFKNGKKLKNAYPLISALIGAFLGGIIFVADPFIMETDSMFAYILIGMSSGLSATGGNEMVQRMKKNSTKQLTPADNHFVGHNNSIDKFPTHACSGFYLPTAVVIFTKRAVERKKRTNQKHKKNDYESRHSGHYHVGKRLRKICIFERSRAPFCKMKERR